MNRSMTTTRMAAMSTPRNTPTLSMTPSSHLPEFQLNLPVQSLQANAGIVEVPLGLHKDRPSVVVRRFRVG